MSVDATTAPSASNDGYDPTEAATPADAPVNGEGAEANGNGAATEAKAEGKKGSKKAKAKDKAKSGGGLGGFFTKRAAAAAAAELNEPPPATAEEATARRKRRRRRRAARIAMPSWGVSFILHLVILGGLAAMTFSTEAKKILAKIDSAMVSNPGGADELVKVYAEPSNAPRDQAVGGGGPAGGGASGGGAPGAFGGIGTGPPSAAPPVNGGGGGINEKNGLPGVKMVANVSGLNLLPSAGVASMDLGGGGQIAGDVAFEAKDIGAALDQLAREILRHLTQHKLTVVWLFDESESMKDDQKTVRQKFDRISSELKVNVDGAAKAKKETVPLNHVIIGFGKDVHAEIGKPTADIDQIGRAIDKLRIDDTGIENTMHVLGGAIEEYSSLIKKDRRLLIVLVTDESGDDGSYVEEVHQLAVQRKVPIYVIGRQSLFGYDRAHLQYIDPVTKDVYWPTIKRGPETADIEMLQWDGLHDRWDEQPSGFAPYELARLSKDTGGIYFLLPSEENMRVRQREKAYSIKDLKEYIPDYEGRAQYVAARNKSEFRHSLYDIIQATRPKPNDPGFTFRRHFPIDPEKLVPACNEQGPISNTRVQQLVQIEKQLRSLSRQRDREPDKRWQAHYDLMLAQIVTYQVKAYEYGACLSEMAKAPPKPKKMPTPELVVEWVIDHSHDRKAPKDQTEKKYQEAEKLLKEVIARHPRTPWADLAQDEINRGFGCQRNEWHHNPKYDERAKLVPKY